MGVLLVAFALLVLLPGCVKQHEKKKTRVVYQKTVRKADLIIPSQELSALSLSKDERAFVLGDCKKSKQCSSVEQAKQFEARFVDIPLPVSSVAKHSCVDDAGCKMMTYESVLSPQDIEHFYKEEMERFGWQQDYLFSGDELVLSFKKPQRVCVVSVRPSKKNWKRSKKIIIILFVSA